MAPFNPASRGIFFAYKKCHMAPWVNENDSHLGQAG